MQKSKYFTEVLSYLLDWIIIGVPYTDDIPIILENLEQKKNSALESELINLFVCFIVLIILFTSCN